MTSTMQQSTLFSEELRYAMVNVQRETLRAVLCAKLEAMFADLDLSDVSYINTYAYDDSKSCELVLKESAQKDSKLAHVLARKFHMKFEKEKEYNGESFQLTGTTPDGIVIKIRGYVGKCEVIKTEIPLTDEEYATAVKEAEARVPRVRVETKLVCN
jgi:hypothetical protein